MRRIAFPVILLSLLTELSGCGGGGSGADTSTSTSAAAAAPSATASGSAPAPVAPPLGAHRVFAEVLVDNLNNTINRTMTSDVTGVGADGSFTVHEEDPSHARTFSGTVDHSLYPTDFHYDATGAGLDYIVTRPTSAVHCSYADRVGNAPARLMVGASWTISYTLACDGGAPLAYTQSSTVPNVETVTVAAGTFKAYKIVSAVSYALNGITHANTVTRWRNADAAQPQTVKETVQYTYSGNPPPSGAPTSFTEELQSYR
jgi:hypothetical protein